MHRPCTPNLASIYGGKGDMSKEEYIQARIAFAREWPHDGWEQDAGPSGKAICSGCHFFGPVVYASMLQWCGGCYPFAAPLSRDTQPKTWVERRKEQELDYGWKAT